MTLINLRLTAMAACLLFFPVPLQAQEAQPVAPVTMESVPPPDAPVVVELFSSQACVFCPQADRLFSELLRQPAVIGLACHVDYFDVKDGSLARPLCTERQNWYVDRLRNGPNYTPQMVMQGTIDVVGYQIDVVAEAMKKAATMNVAPLTIRYEGEGNYSLHTPEGYKAAGIVRVFLYDKPHNLSVADGRNKGQKMIYDNVVGGTEELGVWPEGQAQMMLAPDLEAGNKGFAVILQDDQSGQILAAGKFESVP